MRNAFVRALEKLAAEDDRVIMLSGDIGNRMFDKFKNSHPDRFYNCGAAEANMMGVAAGLAHCGLRPVTYTITPFITTRCIEQIKVDVCFHNLPVIIAAVGGGLSYAELGPTHHSFEDIALMRAMPGMSVVCPGDAIEVRRALRAALQHDGPVYIRLGKKGEPVVHEGPPAFEIGKAIVLREGADVCLLSTGNMLPTAMEAAGLLAARDVSAMAASFHTVKPLDTQLLGEVFASFPLVATIEEHSLVGGFGAAVAEWRADTGGPGARLLRFGIEDRFLLEAGKQKHARAVFGLTPESIAEKIRNALNTKGGNAQQEM